MHHDILSLGDAVHLVAVADVPHDVGDLVFAVLVIERDQVEDGDFLVALQLALLKD